MFQLEMLRVIQDLQREIKELMKAGQGLGNYKKRHRGSGERKSRVWKNTSKYSETTGRTHMKAWNVAGKNSGHQDNATVG